MRIPEGVREVIGRGLDRLTRRYNESPTMASIIGRAFTLDRLKPLNRDSSKGADLVMPKARRLHS